MKVVRRVVLEIVEEFEVPDESNLMNVNKYASDLARSIKKEYRKVRVVRAERVK